MSTSSFVNTILHEGLVGSLPWWGYVTVWYIDTALILAMVISVYLHRVVTHRSASMHPALANFCRTHFWLHQFSRLQEWVAMHRKHHATADTVDDPHSPHFWPRQYFPHVHGVWKIIVIIFLGVIPYINALKDPALLEKWGKGTPDDWLERNIFSKHRYLGVLVLALIMTTFFGVVPGGIIFLAQVLYSPIVAAGFVNGIAHYWGYRNTNTPDKSTNVLPIDFLAGGELLHNNHHANMNSAKFSVRWFEVDFGSGWLKIFETIGLAKITRDPHRKWII